MNTQLSPCCTGDSNTAVGREIQKTFKKQGSQRRPGAVLGSALVTEKAMSAGFSAQRTLCLPPESWSTASTLSTPPPFSDSGFIRGTVFHRFSSAHRHDVCLPSWSDRVFVRCFTASGRVTSEA